MLGGDVEPLTFIEEKPDAAVFMVQAMLPKDFPSLQINYIFRRIVFYKTMYITFSSEDYSIKACLSPDFEGINF